MNAPAGIPFFSVLRHVAAVIVLLFCGMAAGNEWGALADPAVRAQRVAQLRAKAQERKQRAQEAAQRWGWPMRWEAGGAVYELMGIDDSGIPIVYKTFNANSRISIAVDQVQGVPPYFLSGSGLTVGVWDAGAVYAGHQELIGRVNIMQAISDNWHSTAVGGTLAAAGIVPAAKGMAPAVVLDCYDWDNDVTEMTARAMATSGEAGKIALSNHSYGEVAGWDSDPNSSPRYWYGKFDIGERESRFFGMYSYWAKSWDQICYNAPYYLPVKAAGNDRWDNAPSPGVIFAYYNDSLGTWETKPYDPQTDPYSDNWKNGGYDTLVTFACAKNILTVGGVEDAVVNGQRDLSAATMSDYSAWGPTDDGRIKPDVVANGSSVYTCNVGFAAYQTLWGTSLAAPAAAGAAALLQEWHRTLFGGQYMLASTLKALIIHTADDLPPAGPDYKTGWGLINAKAAVEVLEDQVNFPDRKIIIVGDLKRNSTIHNYTLNWQNSGPIRATLCWTDPPPSNYQSTLNDRTKRLVNDLDLRIIAPNGTTYFPYRLDVNNPSALATTGDNNTDNVEQVYISAPSMSGIYTIRVTSKEFWIGNKHQVYSLIVTGHRLLPLAVSNLTAVAGSACGQVVLSWSGVSDAQGYRIYYQESPDYPPFVPQVDGQPASGSDVGNVTSVVVSGLNPLATYHFAVRAYNVKGLGDWSNVSSATPNSGCFVSISGAVRTSGGYGIPDATVRSAERAYWTTTAPDGSYVLSVPLNWTGSVEIEKPAWWFSPASRQYDTPLTADVEQQDYTGIRSADWDDSGAVDLADVAHFASQWLREDCAGAQDCLAADLDLSGGIDLADLLLLTDQWLAGAQLIED